MRIIRAGSILIMAALGWVVAASPAFAQNAPQCVVSGSPPAGWGFNSIGYIEIASGGSCLFSINITGEILSSSVSQSPAHGTLQQLNLSSFIYISEAGYRGRDAFSVQATGKSSDEFWRVSNHYQRNSPIGLVHSIKWRPVSKWRADQAIPQLERCPRRF